MRFSWQCPTCAAQIGNETHARMLTCPFCGSLLIADEEKKKFYLVKNEDSWYFFPKKYLGDNTGYIRCENGEEYYLHENGKWYLLHEGDRYLLTGEQDCKEGEKHYEDKVVELWGALPIVAPPGTVVKTTISDEIICKRTKKSIYVFEKV